MRECVLMKREPADNDFRSSIDLGDASLEVINYFMTGNQYYVSGRFAARAGFLPVYGNFFHHGVEMFIKRVLLQFDDRKRKTHNIKKLWSDLKTKVKLPKLAQFDNCIRELQKFESILYPVERRMNIGVRWSKEDRNKDKHLFGEMPRYEVSIAEIDELVLAIYGGSGIPPTLIGAQMYPGLASEHFEYQNNSLPTTGAADPTPAS